MGIAEGILSAVVRMSGRRLMEEMILLRKRLQMRVKSGDYRDGRRFTDLRKVR